MADDETPSIHALMPRVMAEVGAIGKTGWNPQQKFSFRSIDAVADAVQAALIKHGVFFLPRVIDRDRRDYSTKSGAQMEAVHLHIEYTFYGPRGDSVSGSMWGEAADSGDKATSKAASMAEKYMLLQAFCVSSADQADPDAQTAPARGADPREALRAQIRERAAEEGRSLADVRDAFESAYDEDIRVGSEENLRAFLAAPWVDKADEPTEPAPSEAKPEPATKTPEEFRDALLAAETKADVRRILRDVGLAGHSDAEVNNAKGESLGSLTTLATRLMKELAS